MSEKRFTFFELHLHDSDLQLGPKSIGGGSDEAGAAEPETSETEPAVESPGEDGSVDEEGGSSAAKTGIAALLGLAFLVVVAVAVKKLTGEEADLDVLEELDELEELEDGEE